MTTHSNKQVLKPDRDDYDFDLPGGVECYWDAYDRWLEYRNANRRKWLRACKPWYWPADKRYRWYDAYTWYTTGFIFPGKNWPVMVFFEWWWL